MRDEPKDRDQLAEPAPASGLSPVERWIASVIGLAGVVAGGVGVFLSGNQAGTTAILLLGAVFLLMGVQGTAITKAGKDSVELERRRVARKVLDKAEERVGGNPDEAAGLVEAAKTMDPSLTRDTGVSNLTGFIYERQVLEAIERAVKAISSGQGGKRLDLKVESQLAGRKRLDAVVSATGDPVRAVGIEIKNTSRSDLPDSAVYQALESFREAGMPGIVVSNRTPGLIISNYNRGEWSGIDYDFVLWRDERDDAVLEGILRKMLQASDG